MKLESGKPYFERAINLLKMSLAFVALSLVPQAIASIPPGLDEATPVPQVQSESPISEEESAKPVIEKVNEKVNAAYWLTRLKAALTETNFDAGIVTIKGDKTESFQWSHGYQAEQQLEIERVSPLIGGGAVTVRKGSTVAFIEPNKETYSVKSQSIRNFIPPIFYKDAAALVDSYQFVLVSKSQITGRSAQLIRIESIANTTYNYWVWIDVLSGLPLRMAFVNEAGEVMEQVLMTHLTLHQELSPEMTKLADLPLPAPPATGLAQRNETNNWQMTWLPPGFELLKSDRHHVSISREVSDYYLYGDGLTEVSIYVQRPLESFNSPIVLQDGATSFVMVRAEGFDVTVVGKIPPQIAFNIAKSVKSVQQS